MEIKNFKIRKLFNLYDVKLDLKNPVSIYVGENGLGKTTILNCLYYILTARFEKLRSIIFESIQIDFDDNISYTIKYNDILEYINDGERSIYERNRYYKYITDVFSAEDIEKMIQIATNEGYDSRMIREYALKLNDVIGMPIHIAERTIYRYCIEKINVKNLKGDKKNVVELIEFLKTNSIMNNILYFPTYRRIEEKSNEDVKRIRDYDEDRRRDKMLNSLMNFGMDDIEEIIQKNLNIIKTIAISGFNEMSGLLLKQYVESDIKECDQYNIDNQKLSIALDRIGSDKIDRGLRKEIENIISRKENIKNEEKYLLNLLENLINNYERQNEYDKKIRAFTDTCNKYLKGKKIKYNESSVEVNIINESTNTPININNLSSGEKQILSIFAKLYLSNEENIVLLIDEPELSLSIKWQSMLIPDIVNSKKCKKIVAVTHSPFIFENEYQIYAKSMKNVLNK